MTDCVLHLFEGYGVELEYMIVSRDRLSVLPIADRLIHSIAGAFENQIDWEKICLSNELVLHVVEFKTNGPASSLQGLAEEFHSPIREINRRLESFNARLMPTAMHPWMDPERETQLWPHNFNQVYETYNRIFNCRGHGWSNLQSLHVNLPFGNEEEFGRLHAATRLILPLLPALAASSPVVENRRTGSLDNRMEFYRMNSNRVPSIAGALIPEAAFSRSEYETQIFQKMYMDIAPYDSEGVLRHEWLNARGAIARFDRDSIEIRIVDIQECPQADLAIVFAIASVLQALISEEWSTFEEQKKAGTGALSSILLRTIRNAENALINDIAYLRLFDVETEALSAGELWRRILENLIARGKIERSHPNLQILYAILNHGSLSSRILRRLGDRYTQSQIANVYLELCDCLERGRLFIA